MDKNVLTMDEACAYAGISKSTMYKLTMNRKIRHFKPSGRRIYFKKEDLEEYLTSNSITTIDNIKEDVEHNYKNKKV